MIRGIQLKDCSRVAEIHVFGWRNAYRGIIPDEVLFDKLQVKRCIDYFEKAVQENNEETYVFEEDGLIKGFMTMGEARSEAEDCFELWGLYVEPLMIGGGIGTTFVKFCEREAIRRGYAKNTLWVLEDNL